MQYEVIIDIPVPPNFFLKLRNKNNSLFNCQHELSSHLETLC